jgi:hypothetical protein
MNNAWDKLSLDVNTGEISTLPISNTQFYSNSNVFRCSEKHFIIQGNFDDFEIIDSLVLWRTNISNTAIIRLRLFDESNQGGNVLYDSDYIDAIETITIAEWQWQIQKATASAFDDEPFRYTNIWLEEAKFCKSIEIEIIDDDQVEDYIDITRIFLGQSIQLDVNFSWNSVNKFISNEKQYVTYGGSLHSVRENSQRTKSFSLDYLDQISKDIFEENIKLVGLDKDWFISMYPGTGGKQEVRNAFACKFTAYPDVTHNFYNNHKAPIKVREA